MRIYDIIAKKRDGYELSTEEINYFVSEYTSRNLPDYQAAAILMAIYIQKMSIKETCDLTLAMMKSGECLDLSRIEGIKVDKHSTGGVGDTTTLVLCPLVASCGVPVAKMAGRGLGHTGGTIDKLESIPGFCTNTPIEKFVSVVNETGIGICRQTANLAPADNLLYSLRDVTATIGNISLVTASIMSKKLAAGCDAIVLDVKFGSGAFFKSVDDAICLAQTMVDIGEKMNRRTIAVVTNMDQPLGYAIGNALEVKEAIDTLQNKGPSDLMELVLILGANMVLLGEVASSFEEAYQLVKSKISNGEAFETFRQFLKSHGTSEETIRNISNDLSCKLPLATNNIEILSNQSGYLKAIQCDEIGTAAMILGAGREAKDDIIDMSAGITLSCKIGDFIEKGERLAIFHTCDPSKMNAAKDRFLNALSFADDPVERPKLLRAIITKDDVEHF